MIELLSWPLACIMCSACAWASTRAWYLREAYTTTSDLVDRIAELEDQVAALRQPVDADAPLPAPETRRVKVQCSLEPEDISKMVNRCYADGYNQLATCKKVMDHVLLNTVIKVPEGVPSAQDLREAFADYADSCSRGAEDGKLSPTDFALKYLTPWLREPTGWELDIRPGVLRESVVLHGEEKFLDWLRSRIRPTFGPCQECEKKEAELLLYNNKRTPTQEEKEMELNPYDQNVTVAMMEEELAMKQAEDTLVSELRERWDRAFFAALPVTTAHYLPANRLQAAIIDAADLANETIRRHADMMASRDAVIAEVVG